MPDKIKLICSPLGGYSLLSRDKWHISYMNPDGSLDMPRLEEILRRIANAGANAIREFPWWIQNEGEMAVLSGFTVDKSLPAHNDMIMNPNYFNNQRTIAETAKKYNLEYIFCLYNNSETVPNKDGVFSPWSQWNGDKEFFYKNEAGPYRKQWIEKILETFTGMENVSYDLVNEGSHKYPVEIAQMYLGMLSYGVPVNRLSIGINYGEKKINTDLIGSYKKFSDRIIFLRGEQFYIDNVKRPSGSWSPFHAIDDKRLAVFWTDGLEPGQGVPKGGHRPTKYSTDGTRIDGLRPNLMQTYDMAKRVMSTKSRAVDKGIVAIEVLFGKEMNIVDPTAAMTGLTLAYQEHTGEFPENYGKFPAEEVPPEDTDIDEAVDLLSGMIGERLQIIEKTEKALKLIDRFVAEATALEPTAASQLGKAGRAVFAAKEMSTGPIEQIVSALKFIDEYNGQVAK